jgi:hypothetical protein
MADTLSARLNELLLDRKMSMSPASWPERGCEAISEAIAELDRREARLTALEQALTAVNDSGFIGCIALESDNGRPDDPNCRCDGCLLTNAIAAALKG